MSHHGMMHLHGINAMCDLHPQPEGRFGRLFPDLAPLYINPCLLQKLGEKGGPMDALNKKDKALMPLGMVFLGQFIDHDITLDATSSLAQNNAPEDIRNFRTPTLDLDNIYGGGPEASNYLYTKEKKLHIASTSTAFNFYPGTPAEQKKLKENDLSRNSDGVAIIGDFRNDENRVISQLQLAIIKFHNCVMDYIRSKEEADYNRNNCKVPYEPDYDRIFEEARRVVTWHYQWIVVNEFLPAMIGQQMVDDIFCHGRIFYTPVNRRPYIPIEFSAAAYRFGHSMVPGQFRIQKRGAKEHLFGPVLGSGFQPLLTVKGIVEWSELFDCGGPFEKADALDIKLATVLLDLPFITSGISSLATRNLLRGQSFLLPSGEAVSTYFEECGIDTDHQKVDRFLNKIWKELDYTGCTPLWFYILAEAQVLAKGEHLGPVGGRIVGETIIGLLELDPASYLGQNRQWSPELAQSGSCGFTMCDLVNFCKK